ncbi:MAG: hypothetical protein GX558_09105 [Clostridiales bacterium]|nr:hypothetical protein [Clostridiales bacterium]
MWEDDRPTPELEGAADAAAKPADGMGAKAPEDGGPAQAAERLADAQAGAWDSAAAEDLMLARELRRRYGDIDAGEALRALTNLRDRGADAAEAADGAPAEPMPDAAAIDEARRHLAQTRARDEARAQFVRSLLKQEEAVRREHPDFDLARAIEQSPAFRALILAGEPVGRALDYLRPDEAMARAEQRVAERIRRRSLAPRPIVSANGRAGAGVADMSDAQLRAIDEKLKRGERVYIH